MKESKGIKKWGLIAFMIIIMIGTSFSFILFGFSGVSERVKYNGISFSSSGNAWLAKINGRQAAFSFLPNEVADINVSGGIGAMLSDRLEIDAAYDLNSTFRESIALAQHQMGLTLAAYNIYLRKGFTSNNTFNVPIITCKDATASVPVIYFIHSNLTRIYAEQNCIIAESSSNADFIRVKDRILYGMFGVIK